MSLQDFFFTRSLIGADISTENGVVENVLLFKTF